MAMPNCVIVVKCTSNSLKIIKPQRSYFDLPSPYFWGMEFEYDEEFASYFIHNRLNDALANRFVCEEIQLLLQLEWEYLDIIEDVNGPLNTLSEPIEVDEDALQYYVIFNAVKHNIYLSYAELEEIISLEFEYMEEYGLSEKIH